MIFGLPPNDEPLPAVLFVSQVASVIAVLPYGTADQEPPAVIALPGCGSLALCEALLSATSCVNGNA